MSEQVEEIRVSVEKLKHILYRADMLLGWMCEYKKEDYKHSPGDTLYAEHRNHLFELTEQLDQSNWDLDKYFNLVASYYIPPDKLRPGWEEKAKEMAELVQSELS